MQELISYLFSHYISEITLLGQELLKMEPVKMELGRYLHNTNGPFVKLLTQDSFLFIQFLIAKGYLHYSPSTLEIKLSVANVMFYQRIQKLKAFVQDNLEKNFSQIFNQFIHTDLMPQIIQKKIVQALYHPRSEQHKQITEAESHKNNLLVKGSKKKKEEESSHLMQKKEEKEKRHQNVLDYSRLIYECSSESAKQQSEQKQHFQKKVERKHSQSHETEQYLISINEVTEMYFYCIVDRFITSKRKLQLVNQFKNVKEGEPTINHLSWLEMYLTVKENRSKAQDIKNIIHQIKSQKIEDYLVQLFSKYDLQQDEDQQGQQGLARSKAKGSEKHQSKHSTVLNNSRNTLLIFNLIKKYPYISEKQLTVHSFLSLIEMRKCINHLMEEGLINFYPENMKTTLYKVIPLPEIQKIYVNHIAKTILNIYTLTDNTSNILHHVLADEGTGRKINKEQVIKFQIIIARLDDLLLLFGY